MGAGADRRWKRPTRRFGLNDILEMRERGGSDEGAGAGSGGIRVAEREGVGEMWLCCTGDGNGTGAMSGGGLGGADQKRFRRRPIGVDMVFEMGTFERCWFRRWRTNSSVKPTRSKIASTETTAPTIAATLLEDLTRTPATGAEGTLPEAEEVTDTGPVESSIEYVMESKMTSDDPEPASPF